jgi:mannose-6-phosphate isomerase
MPGRSPSPTHDAHPPIPGLLPLRGVVRRYDWGSHTFLAGLRSQPEPSVEPEAELWFGAHPSAPSMVRLGDRELPLDELIAERAGDLLGAESVHAGAELPFLLKILAADLPLSIQLHPDAERAGAGFEREEGEGIAREARHRLYPDANPKPEIACALTPFHALQELRPPAEARDLLASLGCPEASTLLALGDPAEPAALLAAVLALDGEEARAFATAVAAAAHRVATREAAWVVRLEETYPDDPLIVAPLLLRLVELAPGEALYTPPGVIHSYLGGAVVELMGSSDNVLRAGLTSKHKDRDELLAALDGAPRDPRILHPRALAGSAWREYPETGPLRLSFADVDPAAPVVVEAAAGPCVLLALAGDVVARSADGTVVRLLPGDGALVPASAPACRLDGAGRIYRASAAAG